MIALGDFRIQFGRGARAKDGKGKWVVENFGTIYYLVNSAPQRDSKGGPARLAGLHGGITRLRKRVVVVGGLPTELLPRLDGDCNERFHRDHTTDRPQRLTQKRLVRLNRHAGAETAIFDANVMVLHLLTKALEWHGHRIAIFQGVQVNDFVP